MMTFIVNLEFPGVADDKTWRSNFIKELNNYVRTAVPHASAYEISYIGNDMCFEVVDKESSIA